MDEDITIINKVYLKCKDFVSGKYSPSNYYGHIEEHIPEVYEIFNKV